MRKFGGKLNFKPVVPVRLVECDNSCGAVDMSLHKVSAQASICRNGPLQIYGSFPAQVFQVCTVKGFFEKIERDLFGAMSPNR